MAGNDGDLFVSDLIAMPIEAVRQCQYVLLDAERRYWTDNGSDLNIKDPENLTSEHIEKIRQMLRGLDDPCGFDVGPVKAKLCELIERITTARGFNSFDTLDSNDSLRLEGPGRDFFRRELISYRKLLRDGGIPTHDPFETTFEHLEVVENRTPIVSYWFNLDDGEFPPPTPLERQWRRWEKFRRAQDSKRKISSNEVFQYYIKIVKNYRLENGLDGDIDLVRDHKRQSRLANWKELQYYEYQEADQRKRDLEQVIKDMRALEAKVQAAHDVDRSPSEIQTLKFRRRDLETIRLPQLKSLVENHSVYLGWVDEQVQKMVSGEMDDPICFNSTAEPYESTKAADATGCLRGDGRRVRFSDFVSYDSGTRKAINTKSVCSQDVTKAGPGGDPNMESIQFRSGSDQEKSPSKAHGDQQSWPVSHTKHPHATKIQKRQPKSRRRTDQQSGDKGKPKQSIKSGQNSSGRAKVKRRGDAAPRVGSRRSARIAQRPPVHYPK